MKITGITLWRVDLVSHTTYHMAQGKTCASVPTTIVRLNTDEGLSGWGEVCPIPHYLPAYAGGVVSVVEELAPLLLGADPVGPEAIMYRLDAHLQGHVYAKSAIDIALWDLTARALDTPLYTLLGGRHVDDLPLYHSITCVEPEIMSEIAKEAQQAGIQQFQLKLGTDFSWEKDVARLRLVRETVGHGPLIYGDWNCGASKLHATRVGRGAQTTDVMLEQPCSTLEDCAAVRAASGLPMKIDENAHDTASLLKAYELGCMDVVAIKLSKFGGISACRRARDLCLHLGAQMCIEDTWGSDIAMAAALHLAAATPSHGVLNVCDLSGYVWPRLDSQAPTRKNGRISIPESAGLGVHPNEQVLGEPIAHFE